MLYWECKRRLTQLRQFRIFVVDYFENVRHAGWTAGGVPILNDKAQKARHEINLVLTDTTSSLTLLRIPHTVWHQPSANLGGNDQLIDVILNIFSLWQFRVGSERVLDCIDRAIGAYERERQRLFRASFNPLYWLGLALVWFLRLPFQLLGAAGFDAERAEHSLVGKCVKVVMVIATVIPAVTAVVDHWPQTKVLLHLK